MLYPNPTLTQTDTLTIPLNPNSSHPTNPNRYTIAISSHQMAPQVHMLNMEVNYVIVHFSDQWSFAL